MDQRQAMIDRLAQMIAGVQLDHTVRVGIDGPSAAGKTTLADELVSPIEAVGRPVIRASIDGFHQPRVVRRRRGSECPVGYYEDSFDFGAAVRNVLQPLGPNGTGRFRRAVYDFRVEQAVDAPEEEAPANAVLLFEGVFLMRPELNAHWDVRIYVDVPDEVAVLRARQRDLRLFGSDEQVQRRYAVRYLPGQAMYFDEHAPKEKADIIIRNSDPSRPGMLVRNRDLMPAAEAAPIQR